MKYYLPHGFYIGNVLIGADSPVRLQSMTNTSTSDADATFRQSLRIAEAGGELVRISVKNQTELKVFSEVSKQLKLSGYDIPLIADVHFSLQLALEAAKVADKVRINPGNYYGKNVSEEKYLSEIKNNLQELVDVCRHHDTAIRIGTNHGSLSQRIKEKFGAGPEAMAEATMEFARILADMNMVNTVLSIKASSARDNILANRLLVEILMKEGYSFPLHLGVTEAGLGFSGRIKSAVGIASLLADGIGDTIRVSLTEAPEHEIPVARDIALLFSQKKNNFEIRRDFALNRPNVNIVKYPQILSDVISKKFLVIGSSNFQYKSGLTPDVYFESVTDKTHCIFWKNDFSVLPVGIAENTVLLIETSGEHSLYDISKAMTTLKQHGINVPCIWKRNISENEPQWRMRFAAELGCLLTDNAIRMCMVDGIAVHIAEAYEIVFEVLQACSVRVTHAEFISCPSCNRTGFDILHIAEEVRRQTHHLKHLRIAVMGCIVNGPGEMGEVDYGFVGQNAGKVALFYKGSSLMQDILSSDAVEVLIALIKQNGDWVEPVVG